jgi:hypothetical protein
LGGRQKSTLLEEIFKKGQSQKTESSVHGKTSEKEKKQ